MSVDDFEATAGLAFLLGYFGDHTVKLLTAFRDKVLELAGQANRTRGKKKTEVC